MATPSNCKLDEIHFQLGSCKIILKGGDLLNETNVEALVIPAPAQNETQAQNFALFRSVCERSSFDEKRQIDKLHSSLENQKAQSLLKSPSNYIFVVPPYLGNHKKASELLRKTYTSCLELAAKNNFRSIAFPTIGCGVIGFDRGDAVHCIWSALENFIKSNKNKMHEIRFVIYDINIHSEFTSLFMGYARKNNTKFEWKSTSTNNSNPSEMSRTDDRHSASNQRMDRTETTHNPGAIEDTRTSDNTRNNPRQITSSLNPDAPEFRVETCNQSRTSCRFYLKDTRRNLIITRGDILKTKVDAIVNVVDETMLSGDEVDKCIRQTAGQKLQNACRAYKEIEPNIRLPTGRSRVLLSYNLSKTTYYIINTAGPRYDKDSDDQCKKQLTSCYQTSLDLANIYDLEAIAFPAISCTNLGYPLDEAAEIALTTINNHEDYLGKIFFVLSDDDTYDAWVKKAEELQFKSQNDTSTNDKTASTKSGEKNNQTRDNPSNKNNVATNKASAAKESDKHNTTVATVGRSSKAQTQQHNTNSPTAGGAGRGRSFSNQN